MIEYLLITKDQQRQELACEQDRRHKAELAAESHRLKAEYEERRNEEAKERQKQAARDMQLEISRCRNMQLIFWFSIPGFIYGLLFDDPTRALAYGSMGAGVGKVCGSVMHRVRKRRLKNGDVSRLVIE